jgi:hypothetical protein
VNAFRDHREAQKRERQRVLAELLRILHKAREERAEWYVWVEEHRKRRLGERS